MLFLVITILVALSGIMQTNYYSNIHDDGFDVQSNEAEQRWSCRYHFYSYQSEAFTHSQINKSNSLSNKFVRMMRNLLNPLAANYNNGLLPHVIFEKVPSIFTSP
jgi:hypothetical protein